MPQTRDTSLRVLFFDTRDHTGGHATVHNALIRHFDQTRTRPFAIANSATYDSRTVEEAYRAMPGLEWTALPFGDPLTKTLGPAHKVRSLATSVRCLARAIAQARRWRIDVVHTNEHRSNAFYGVLLSRAIGAKYVFHMHANATHLTWGTLFGLRHASAVLAVSDPIRKELMAIGVPESRIHVVHNGVDASRYTASQFGSERAAIRRSLQIPDASPLVGIAARITSWKGQRELVEAIHRLLPDFPDVRLAIIGGTRTPDDPSSFNETERELRQRVAELGLESVVHFTGWQADVRPWLAALDIFALPSYGEPFSIALLEAMATGLPSIACLGSGATDIMITGRNGMLVSPRSVDELKQALGALLADPERRRRIGQDGRQLVQERLTLGRQADRVSDIYSSLATPSAGAVQSP
jgi:glycosyltransferase involved in cell wall biosynthesis